MADALAVSMAIVVLTVWIIAPWTNHQNLS